MSLISFIKDAGEKLFGKNDATVAAAPAPAAAAPSAPGPDRVAELNAAAGGAIKKYIETQKLSAENLNVVFDGASHTVTVSGVAADQETREKIVLCCGNVASVDKVDDRMTVAAGAAGESKFHTVESGDTLSKIALKFYGNASQYNKIFEANRPMLSNPDKIYPGQVLRIPS